MSGNGNDESVQIHSFIRMGIIMLLDVLVLLASPTSYSLVVVLQYYQHFSTFVLWWNAARGTTKKSEEKKKPISDRISNRLLKLFLNLPLCFRHFPPPGWLAMMSSVFRTYEKCYMLLRKSRAKNAFGGEHTILRIFQFCSLKGDWGRTSVFGLSRTSNFSLPAFSVGVPAFF